MNYLDYIPISIDSSSIMDRILLTTPRNPYLTTSRKSSNNSTSELATAPITTPTWVGWSKPSSTTLATNVGTLLNLNGWNLDATLLHLTSRARAHSQQKCAAFVWNALNAGGISGRFGHARDVAKSKSLELIGFKPISRFKDSSPDTSYKPLAGDIVVSAPDNNPSVNGHHAAMYNGQLWISDFKQRNLDVFPGVDNEWIIYRRTV